MLFIDNATGKEPIIPGDYLIETKQHQTSIFDTGIDDSTYEDISTKSILDDLDKILAEEAKKSDVEVKDELPKTIVVTRSKPGVVDKKEEETPNTIVFKKVNLFGEEF